MIFMLLLAFALGGLISGGIVYAIDNIAIADLLEHIEELENPY